MNDYHVPHSLEKTEVRKTEIWHYTCNSPSFDVLKKNKIIPIGDEYNCKDIREVLLIPIKLYKKHGLDIYNSNPTIQSEILLRKLK